MAGKTSLLQTVRRIALAFLLIFMVQEAVTPAPAFAQGVPVNFVTRAIQEVANWVEKAAQYVMKITGLESIISGLTEVINLVLDKFEDMVDNTETQGAIQSFIQTLTMLMKVAEYDAKVNANWSAQMTSVDAAYAAKHAAPPHQELCKSILVHQLVTTTEDFEREVSRAIAEAVANRGRCPGCDENGGDRAAVEFIDRLQSKYLDPLDGVPQAVDTTTRSALGEPLHGADARAVSPLQVYEMPSFVSKVYTDPTTKQQWVIRALNPSPTTPEQKFFKAQVSRLFHAAGSRPTPLMGAQLFTPRGMVQRAMFNHCAANEAALIKQCTDYLAYFTRPNSTDTASETLRNAQNQRCEAITGTIDKTQFGNCKLGLSPYEAQKLTLLWCQSIQQSAGMNMSGASPEQVRYASDLCSSSWSAWQAMMAQKKMNCTNAMAARASLRECWASTNALGPKGETAELLQNPEYLARWRTLKNVEGLELPVPILEINATKLKKAPQGQPVAFDEIELPKAVGQ